MRRGGCFSGAGRSIPAVGVGDGVAQLRDRHEAEDVAQAAFLLAYRRISTLADDSKFGPWLMKIAPRQIIDFARRRKIPVTTDAEQSPDPTMQSDSTWIQHEDLLKLVSKLPDHERALVGLRYFDGLSVAETAAATGRPVGTVTKQLSRALARLRGWWAKENSP